MPTPRIYGAAMSNFVWSVRLLAAEKGITCEHVPEGPHKGEIARISPTGKMPVLIHGDVELFESKAIATYLDLAFPGPRLIPADAVGAAKVEQWVSYANSVVDPCIIRRYALGYVFPGTPDGSPDRARIDAAVPEMNRILAVLDRALASSGYIVGNGLTYADLNLLPIIFYATRFPEGKAAVAAHPHLAGWLERLRARPSFAATRPPPPPSRS